METERKNREMDQQNDYIDDEEDEDDRGEQGNSAFAITVPSEKISEMTGNDN